MIGPADNYESAPAVVLTPAEIARRFELEDAHKNRVADRNALARLIRQRTPETAEKPKPTREEIAYARSVRAEKYWTGPEPTQSAEAECEVEAIEEIEAERLTDYEAHLANRSGFVMDTKEWGESIRRRFDRFTQSMELAACLERTGVRANYAGTNRPRPFIVCPISRKAIPLPMLRRVNFFPEQAAMRRAAQLAEVETWLARPGNKWARMATFTAGRRVPTEHIRGTHGALTRRMSKMAKTKWFSAVASLVFRAVEFGTPKLEIGEVGPDWFWHVHSHAVFRPHRKLARREWADFCARVARYMGAHWDAGRPVKNARELVKYPVKPCDLETLAKVGGDFEVRRFFEATFKLRIAEMLGTLREQRHRVRLAKKKRCKERTRSGEWVSTVRRDWNRRGRVETEAEIKAKRDEQTARRERIKALREAAGFCVLPHPEAGRDVAPMLNRIVARLSPAAYATPVFEPGFLVWNFDGNFDAIANHPAVAGALAKVRDYTAFQIETHRRGEAAHNSSHQSRNCPAGLDDFGLAHAPPDTFRHHFEAVSA